MKRKSQVVGGNVMDSSMPKGTPRVRNTSIVKQLRNMPVPTPKQAGTLFSAMMTPPAGNTKVTANNADTTNPNTQKRK